MKICLIFYFVISIGVLKAEKTDYPVVLIPDSLKKDANAVIRYDSISYHLISPGKAKLTRHKVVTILNHYGEEHAQMYVLYDKNSKVNSFSGEVLDKSGKRIRKIKKGDIKDKSLVGNYTLFQDDRYVGFEALNHSYPYSVVVDYEVTYDGIVSINRWMPVPGYKVSVEKSIFSIISENNQKVNFKQINLPVNCQTDNDGNQTVYRWEITNQTALEAEPYSPSVFDIFPVLWSTPEKFEYEGTLGEYKSWKSFGEWQWNLVKGKQEISDKTKNKIRELTKNAATDKEKAALVYKYFQDKTRYVSVQLGIGGWEPFSASVVDELGYGDCKALSNYMVALLEAVRIKSYYAVIGNGSSNIKYPDFPSMGQANHVIVCVPFSNDSTWLECTSQEYPFGYIGSGNNNRYALLITEEGGKLVKTPSLDKDVNLQIRNAEVTLDEQGNADAVVSTEFSGLQFGNRNFLLTESKEEQKKWYLNDFDFNSPVLNSFEIQKNNEKPVLSEKLKIQLPGYSTLTGNRMFLTPNLLNSFSRPPSKAENRRFPFERDFPYTDVDSVVFVIPDGFSLESAMDDVNVENEFGKYSTSVNLVEDRLVYVRKIEMNSGTWPADKYDDFRSFFSTIWKADNGKVVFIKN